MLDELFIKAKHKQKKAQNHQAPKCEQKSQRRYELAGLNSVNQWQAQKNEINWKRNQHTMAEKLQLIINPTQPKQIMKKAVAGR